MSDYWDIFDFELDEDGYIPQHKLPKEERLRKCRRCGGVQIPYVLGMGQMGDGYKKIIVTGCIVNFPVPIGWCEDCHHDEFEGKKFVHNPRITEEKD
jgi:hypothetical protein